MGSKFYLFLRNLALVLGATFLVFAIQPLAKFHSTSDWPQSLGTITRAKMTKGKSIFLGFHEFHRVNIEFTYRVNGKLYRGNHINYGIASDSFLFERFAEVVVQRYPIGKTVPVYYNPDDPTDEVVERIPMPGFSMLWILLTFLFFLLAVFITLQKKKIQSAIDKPLQRSLRPGEDGEGADFKDHYPAAIYNPPPESERNLQPTPVDGEPRPRKRPRREGEEQEVDFKDHYPAAVYNPPPEAEQKPHATPLQPDGEENAGKPRLKKRPPREGHDEELFKAHYPQGIYTPQPTEENQTKQKRMKTITRIKKG